MLRSKPGTRGALRGPDTTGGQDVAILSATRIGLVVLGLLLQGILAYTLFYSRKGIYTVCAVFGILLGIEAAAWATTIGMICRCLLLAIVFRKTTRMAWLPIWLPRGSDASFLWAAGQSVLGPGTSAENKRDASFLS